MPEFLMVVFGVVAAVIASLSANRFCWLPRRCPLVIDGGDVNGHVL